MKDYGKALKNLRTSSHMTQAKLAEALNVTYQTVSKWENNVNMPDITVLEAVCNVFGVTVDEFLRMAESPTEAEPTDGEPAAETVDDNAEPKAPRFCEKCGAAVAVRYCPKCGYDTLDKVTAAERDGTSPAAANASEPIKPHKRMKKGAIAAVISVAVVAFIATVLAIVLPIALRFRSTPTPDDTPDVPPELIPTPTSVTVRFDRGDGVGTMANSEVMTGVDYVLPKCAFVRVGYEFDRWSYAGKTYAAGSTIRFAHGTTAATIAAVWKPITYNMDVYFNTADTVWFDGQRLNGYEVYTITCRYGEDPFAADDRKIPETYGMVFDGFTVYDAYGQIYNGDIRYINSDKRKSIRAEANWMSGRYDIVLHAEGYGERKRIYDCSGKNEYTLPTVEELGISYGTGYVFDCWKYEFNDDAPHFADGATVSDLKRYGFSYGTGTDTVDLIAVWKPIEYTIVFDGNGGDGTMTELACKYNEEYTLPENAFVKDGYMFAGWKSGDKVFVDGKKIKNLTQKSETLTFSARWLPVYAGAGTDADPYRIGDYAELSRLSDAARNVVGMDARCYALTADIDCEGKPLSAVFGFDGGSFSGVFDGGGHEIKNAVFSPTSVASSGDRYSEYMGLFGFVEGGEIKDVGLRDYTATGGGDTRITPLCASYSSDKPLKNCFAVGNIYAENKFTSYASGFIGSLNGVVQNCYSSGNIKLTYTRSSGETWVKSIYVAGFIITPSSGSVVNCYADVDIDIEIAETVTSLKERMYCAPFFANIGVVKNCFSTGGVHVNRYYDNYGKRMLCDFVGSFGADDYYPEEKIDNVYVSTDVAVVFDDNPDFAPISLTGQKTAPLADLCSLDWLAANVGFDASVWAETPDGLPRLVPRS